MPNEFIARNGIIALNDSTISGSLFVSGSISGSLANKIIFNSSGSGSTPGTQYDNTQSITVTYSTIGANKVITYGTALPTGGSDGDIYLQYIQ